MKNNYKKAYVAVSEYNWPIATACNHYKVKIPLFKEWCLRTGKILQTSKQKKDLAKAIKSHQGF